MANQPQSTFQAWIMDRGIKQSWLAQESKLRQPLISKIATGKTNPDVYQAQKIVAALRKVSPEVSIEELWPLTEEDGTK